MSFYDYGDPDEDRFSQIATPADACREYARNVGATCPERAWINTDFDTWERNPFYTGPDVPHPESYEPDDGEEVVDLNWDEAPF
jgi:hypothetical protein